MAWFDSVWSYLREHLFQTVPGWAIAIGAALLVVIIIQYLWGSAARDRRWLKAYRRAGKAVMRRNVKGEPREAQRIWLTKPIRKPEEYGDLIHRNLRVLAVANAKGGVGKTTLAANLAACYAIDWNKRVLLIDLSDLGSLSTMALPLEDWVPEPGGNSSATKLVSGDLTPAGVIAEARSVPLGDNRTTGSLNIITAHSDLAEAESRVLVEFLLNTRKRRHVDARYALAEVLHSPEIRNAFDLVVIDCPPRFTAAAIQGLCAASHLLVPTTFDRPSANAVVAFAKRVEEIKRELCPHLHYVGVVGNKWMPLGVAGREAVGFINQALAEADLRLLPEANFIKGSADLITYPGDGIAYIAGPIRQPAEDVREAIRSLARVVGDRIGLPKPRVVESQPKPVFEDQQVVRLRA